MQMIFKKGKLNIEGYTFHGPQIMPKLTKYHYL